MSGAARQNEAVLEVKELREYFYTYKGLIRKKCSGVTKAVDNVTFQLKRGETLGLVGESGCGKSTLGRTILGMYKPTGGSVVFNGGSMEGMDQRELRSLYRRMQMIFQDPYSSLNPKMKVSSILSEPFVIHGLLDKGEREDKVRELLAMVGLDESFLGRYPHEFSGGQRQRIGIARALALDPEVIICDEAVSALDVSIQAQTINLLGQLQKKLGLSYLFISHNLAVVKHISDRVAVMYLGRIVELAEKDALYRNPLHPYTRALISAAMVPDPLIERTRKREILAGDPPSPKNPPPGCRFHTRCTLATEECRSVPPELRNIAGGGHMIACHHA